MRGEAIGVAHLEGSEELGKAHFEHVESTGNPDGATNRRNRFEGRVEAAMARTREKAGTSPFWRWRDCS